MLSFWNEIFGKTYNRARPRAGFPYNSMNSTKKIIGIIAILVAAGMFLMMIANNRLVGLIIIALLLFLGYNCLCGD